MGIIRLNEFIRKQAPSAIRATVLAGLRGRLMAVDASSTIYKFLFKTQTLRGPGQ
jgi:hypothetical protein